MTELFNELSVVGEKCKLQATQNKVIDVFYTTYPALLKNWRFSYITNNDITFAFSNIALLFHKIGNKPTYIIVMLSSHEADVYNRKLFRTNLFKFYLELITKLRVRRTTHRITRIQVYL